MTTQFQLRRGTAAQTATFTGALAEVTVDTTNNVLVVHDSITPGGWPTIGANSTQTLRNKTLVSALFTGNTSFTGNILPGAADTYNIGSSALPFHNLYLSGNTIYLGTATIGTTANAIVFTNPVGGTFTVAGNDPAGSTGTFGNLVANSTTASTSTSTGALIVRGGAGIAGNVVTNAIYAAHFYNADGSIFAAGGYSNVEVGAFLTTYSGNLAAGNANIAGGISTSSASISGSASIGGNTNISGSSNVTGNSAVGGSSRVTGNSNVGGSSSVTGSSSVGGDSSTGGNSTVAGNSTVTGNLDVHGTLSQNITIPASANQIYVAKNGSDTNNGTLNQPFLTIKAAMAAAGPGTSVQIAPGTYTENNPIRIPDNVSLMGDNLRSVSVVPQNPNSDLFYTGGGCYVWGITIKNYNANGFAYSSTQSANTYYVSPYIQNITSSTTSPGATAVMVDGNFTSASSTKGMIVGFFTIINQAGVGVHLTNLAYSQLVNIYTIGANVGIWSESGAFCTLNGSDNSIGNIGLRADGTGPLQSYGLTTGYSTAGSFTISNPSTPPHVNQVVVIQGDSSFYTIDTISKLDAVTYKVNVLETYTGNLAPGSNITFYQRSEVVASAHTFEYVGAGTNPATALPQYGGYPNANLNVVMTGGGRVSYTATDEKGNFYIGSNLIVNQATSTITGDAFNKSLFSQMTPYILALSEGP